MWSISFKKIWKSRTNCRFLLKLFFKTGRARRPESISKDRNSLKSKVDDNIHVHVLQNRENKVKRLVKLVLLFFKQILTYCLAKTKIDKVTLSLSLSLCLSLCLCPSVSLSLCLCVCVSVSVRVSLSLSFSLAVSLCLSLSLSVSLSVSLSLSLSHSFWCRNIIKIENSSFTLMLSLLSSQKEADPKIVLHGNSIAFWRHWHCYACHIITSKV